MMGSHFMILFHTISRYYKITSDQFNSILLYDSVIPLTCWFCSIMKLMEKVEMTDAMIILAGIVVLKVVLFV